MSEKRKYDSTVARIAGNIAGNMLDRVLVWPTPQGTRYTADTMALIAADSVALARLIVAEVEHTEPVSVQQMERMSPQAWEDLSRDKRCTCQVVKQCSWASIDPNCPVHGTRRNTNENAKAPARSIDG